MKISHQVIPRLFVRSFIPVASDSINRFRVTLVTRLKKRGSRVGGGNFLFPLDGWHASRTTTVNFIHSDISSNEQFVRKTANFCGSGTWCAPVVDFTPHKSMQIAVCVYVPRVKLPESTLFSRLTNFILV